jgi:bifunctional DNA-binding transcriptional regulator/antitoxin component of YhaV-PrlF toxin-antitoxin module
MKTKLTKRGQTVVPYKIRRQFGLGESSMLEWMVEKDVITVLPVPKKRVQALKGSLKGHVSFEAFMEDRRADREMEKVGDQGK